MSPCEIRCDGCGNILWNGNNFDPILHYMTRRNNTKWNNKSAIEMFIKEQLHGKCPKCGRKLCLSVQKFEAKPIQNGSV